MILDGHAQTVEMKATALFGIQEIYEWHFNDSGDLVEDEFPKLDRQSTTEFAGDWYEVHVDKSDTRIARLTVTDNDSGTQRKITIHAECWGKGDIIHITQNPL